ncbi:MAG: response regulator [Thermodesulfobacteriota bacterium]
MHILVAENDSANATGMKARIDDMGHRADIVSSSAAAIAAASRNPYELAFVALELDEADECPLIQRLKQLCPRLPVVAMTRGNSRQRERKARDQGVIYYMIQPADAPDTEEIIRFLSEKQKRQSRKGESRHG